ncbi:MAG: FecR domain-containing protein [Thermoanaerobaculia bacterium]|nr:FecR domain-containing protein [Thermoanaerobaculia bacterium]
MRATILTILGLLAATAVLAQSAPQARPGDTVAWHVVKPGETLSSITGHYLGDSTFWPENHRLNPGVKDPNKLTPGQRVLVITAREIAARRAKVDQLSRKVEKKLQQESWLSAKVGDQLVEREGLRTYESSSAQLGLDDGSRLQMTENSIVFLREYKASLRKVDRSQIEVIEGGVDLALTPAKTRAKRDVEILIGDVRARPKATDATSESRARKDQATKSAKLMVYSGATEVEAGGVKLQVPKGMGTSVTEGAAPSAPEKLLAAPALVAPAQSAETRGPTELGWSPVANAQSYVVEICRDPACAQLVTRQTGIEGTTASMASLPIGNLHWRVTARSKAGLDGYPSKTRELASVRVVTGRVMFDPRSTGDASSLHPIEGAVVRLYADNGDGTPGEGDAMKSESRSDATGSFELGSVGSGVYWVAVDSRSASPAGTWREQTWGSAGSFCADGNGGSPMRSTDGACFGGRRGGVADSFETLAGAEHVAKVEVSDAVNLAGLDFAFSDAAVTTVADAEPALQGSLRQFLLNAQASAGERAMRFVPAEPANSSSGSASWWRVSLAAALPALAENTLVDGRAWSLAGLAIDSNPGTLGSAEKVGVDGVALKNPDRPELEIDGRGAVAVVVTTAARGAIANLAVTGATQQQIVVTAPLSIENSVVGMAADGTASATVAQVGVDATADLSVSRAFVANQSAVGIRVWSDDGRPKLRAHDLEAAGCGVYPVIQVRASGAELSNSLVRRCDDTPGGLGIEFLGGSVPLGVICRDHKVTGSTIRGFENGIAMRLGAMDNVIEGNVIDASARGVMLQHIQSHWTPKGNRISRNRWLGDNEPIALEGIPGLGLASERLYIDAIPCSASGTSVDRALDFMGVGSVERVESGIRVTGKVCPEATVEVYSRTQGRIEYLGAVTGDAAGTVDGVVATSGGAPRDLALVSIDKTGTTSRLKFGSTR